MGGGQSFARLLAKGKKKGLWDAGNIKGFPNRAQAKKVGKVSTQNETARSMSYKEIEPKNKLLKARRGERKEH